MKLHADASYEFDKDLTFYGSVWDLFIVLDLLNIYKFQKGFDAMMGQGDDIDAFIERQLAIGYTNGR